MSAIDTKSFKSGNSVAVRFPRGLGLDANIELTITRDGNGYLVQPRRDVAEGRRRVRHLVERLLAVGPPDEIEHRDADIFPDRPGLYD
jgi:antitoxin VapB